MAEIGEELVGAWLGLCGGCDLVQYNVQTGINQGEIDVVGIDFTKKIAYVCEVSTHIRGLQYTSHNQDDNVKPLTTKFLTAIQYARDHFIGFQPHFMLWSPVVKRPKNVSAKGDQIRDLMVVRQSILDNENVEIELVINKDYLDRVDGLRNLAQDETKSTGYPVFRLMQIYAQLEAHVEKLTERDKASMEFNSSMESE